MDLTCITNVVGISTRDCPCLDAKPGDWSTVNTSKSGYYVDNPEFTIPLQTSVFEDCDDDGNIWDLYQAARNKAINDVVTRLLLSIGDFHSASFGNVKATIGQKKQSHANISGLTDNWVGHRYTPLHVGATLTVRTVDLQIDLAGTYAIKLMKEDGTEIGSYDYTSAGSNASDVQSPTTLTHRFTDLKPVYLVFDRGSGVPVNSEIYCPTCGGKTPYYYNYLNVAGVSTTDETNWKYATTANSHRNYGLFAEVTYQCDYLAWLCDTYDDFWSSTEFGRLFGKVLEMMASWHVNHKILNTANVNYYTLVAADTIAKQNVQIAKLVDEMIPVLASKLPNDFSNCFTCKSYHDMAVQEYIIT